MVFVPYSFKLAADVSFALGEIFSRFVGEYFVFYIELTLVFVMSPIMIFLNGFQDQLLRAEHLSFFQVLQVIKRGNMLLRGRNLKICAVAVAAWAAIFLSILLPFLAVRLISPSRVVRMIFVLVSASPAAAFFYLLPVATYYSLRSERETRELSEIFD
jgi:hypothetical protein